MKRLVGAATISLLELLLQTSALRAQAPIPPAERQLSALQEITINIIRAIGAGADTVEIARNGNILTIARINSNMNEGTHAGRDNEANAIARLVVRDASGKPEFKTLTTIRVQYIIRSVPGSSSKIVDTIDFRKSPSGVFEFHTT